MKILLSTGNGRLHLMTSSRYLKNININIDVLTGWLPKNTTSITIKLASYLTSHKNLASGMQKRLMPETGIRMISCALPEFLTQFLFLLSRKTGIITKDVAAAIGWTFFGWYSSFYIKDYDIFHVRAGAGCGGAIIKAKKQGMKVITDYSIAHPSFFDESVNLEIQKYNQKPFITSSSRFWKMAIRDCNLADIVLVNSHFVKQTFVDHGFDENKIKVVYLGVREDFYRLKKDYTKGKVLRILFTGSFEMRKGAEYILKAMQILDRMQFLHELIIVGSNMEASNLLKKYPAKCINLVGHVPQDELKVYLSTADIYLFPSLGEGCASSAMEAMAAGLPVIATRESGIPMIDHVNGIQIPFKSEKNIVDAIFELNDNINLRKRLGENAAEKIIINYTWNMYAEQVKNLYSKILGTT